MFTSDFLGNLPPSSATNCCIKPLPLVVVGKQGNAHMSQPSLNKHGNLLEKAQNILSGHGYRMTQARLEILKVLVAAHRPLKITEIFEQTQKKTKIDRVSAYRVIEVFKKAGIIHQVSDSCYTFCSHPQDQDDSHLYLICDQCHSVEEIDLPTSLKKSIQKQVFSDKKFKSQGPIQVSGLCSQCAS